MMLLEKIKQEYDATIGRKEQLIIDIFCYSTILFLISSVFESELNKYVPINKILGIVIFASIFLIFIKYASKFEMFLIFIEGCICLISLAYTEKMLVEFMDWSCFFNTTIIVLSIKNSNVSKMICNFVDRKSKLILYVLIFISIVFLMLIIFKIGYKREDWGGYYYFVGFSDAQHSVAAICCFSLMLLLCISNKYNKILCNILSLIIIYTLMETTARTYLVVAIIYLFAHTFLFYDNKVIIRLIGSLFILLLMLINSKSFQKISFHFDIVGIKSILSTKNDIYERIVNVYADPALNNSNYLVDYSIAALDGISNGRVNIFKNCISFFSQSKLVNKLFGSTFASVYQTNLDNLGTYIWAHCDFTQILIGSGVCGLFVYLYSIVDNIRKIFISNKKIFALLIIVYIFFSASLNGFYNYANMLFGYMYFYTLIMNK